MKKLTQKGFSLAEILIALAIISVISTLGFSIAKKGIEDAYQGYFYTGYNGLYTALSIAKEKDVVVLLGKGHETYQEIKTGKIHLDEREEIAAYFAKR